MTEAEQKPGRILFVYVQTEAHIERARRFFDRAFKSHDLDGHRRHLTPGGDVVRGYDSFEIVVVKEDPQRPAFDIVNKADSVTFSV